MVETSLQKTMEEENPNNCRALITRDPNMPPNSPLSYFINITIPQPKLRIKIPKLLVKTMQRRNQKCNDADEFDQSKKKNKWAAKRRRLLRRKVGLIINNVFGSKKSQQRCSSNCGNHWVHSNVAGCLQQNETQIKEEVEEDNLGSVQNGNRSNDKHVNGGDEPFLFSTPESKISKSHSLKEILEIESERERQEMLEEMAAKQPLKGSLSLTGFFIKKNNLSFVKRKMNKSYNCSSNYSNGGDHSGNGGGGGSSYRAIGRQKSSGNLSRVPSGRAMGCRYIMRVKSTRQKVTKLVEEESEQGEELCKKRILMGEKCKPLNSSGSLHYDENGILLPESIPFEELEISQLNAAQFNKTGYTNLL